MSIINQALQKAQREQLRHSQQEMPYRLPVQRTPALRRWWFLAPLGVVAAIGVGATLPTWLLTPMGHVPVLTEPAATSSSLGTSIPLIAPLPTTSVVLQTVAEPALPEGYTSPLPAVPEPSPLAPGRHVRRYSPMPTDNIPPPPAPAPAPPSAAVPLPRYRRQPSPQRQPNRKSLAPA